MKKFLALVLIAFAIYIAWLSLVVVAGSVGNACLVIVYAFAQAFLISGAKALLGVK